MSGELPMGAEPASYEHTDGWNGRILFATVECYPFVKVGGLADVSHALPKELAGLGHEVRVVLPAYPGMSGRHVLSLDVRMGSVVEKVDVSHLAHRDGVDVYTVGSRGWFDREVPYSYQDEDVLPFVLFSKAVAALAAHPDWRPDVIHANDWHCGLIAQEVRQGAHAADLERCAVVFTIHNVAYQGHVGASVDMTIGLPPAGNLLARGVAFADQVNTVSPQYMAEILTPEHGAGMDALLRSRGSDARGIRNGVDYAEFTPAADPWIAKQYDESFVLGKQINKRDLQAASGLETNPRRPLFGMVARLVPQKGVGLVRAALDDILARGAQVVVAGEGERRYRRELMAAGQRHPGSVAYHPSSDEGLARSIYAGADFFLAPSRFEPCGLTPLIALRYGTIPIVRETGGMVDTIPDYTADSEQGLGFVFRHRRVASLVESVDRGLSVFHRVPEWHELQRRAMSADFSWRAPAQEYVALYRAATRSRTRPPLRVPRQRWPDIASSNGAATIHSASPARLPLPGGTPHDIPLPLALVHHANQYLITDGYRDREGISSLVHGYAALLQLHKRYRVPASLHLSGTLIESAAWHHPWFLELVRDLHASGLVDLIGGTYSENVLTAFDPGFNRRQLEEAFDLYQRHLGCAPEELSGCWVPERIWDTEAVSELLTSPDLPNGGYRYVLLDDRLLYPTGGRYHGSDRELFDLGDPMRPPPTDALRPYRIRESRGLEVVPMSTRLRYWLPPQEQEHWRSLNRLTDLTLAPGDDAVLVYADDLEKTAGLGPWRADGLNRYEAFLRWLVSQPKLVPVRLSEWLAQRRRPAVERSLDPGTFVELSQQWGAGEDYQGWANDPDWVRSRSHLDHARRAIEAAEQDGAAPGLVALAWKHLLASSYETAWRDTSAPGRPLAPWSKALASHARSSTAIAAAARWLGASSRPPYAELADVDGDGDVEVVLANDQVVALLTPRDGGRLVQLATRSPSGGALMIGNPSDDWNWQESVNRYMDEPANHPGALADVGFAHDRYDATLSVTDDAALVDLVDVQEDSFLRGARKRLLLHQDSSAILVRYELPDELFGLAVDVCLSPDYLSLLRNGRSGVRRIGGRTWRGVRNGSMAAWVALDANEPTSWRPPPAGVGHGVMVRLQSTSPVFHLLLGVGDLDEEAATLLLDRARGTLDRFPTPASGAGVVMT
ncbi:MAG TPA: glycogen/starch synthase [Nocardioidaceae bacterium]|nr:glycogen/starch synthase [Nocardioidaceae bacterium]